jgi:DNA-binding transcriptional regulator YdaS (Cro superfamily)
MKLSDYLLEYGAKAKLAKEMKVSPVLITQWSSSIRPVPVVQCVHIEKITNKQVTRKDLRPDDWESIWPELVEVD